LFRGSRRQRLPTGDGALLPRLRVVGDGGELALIAQWVAESHAAAVLALAKTSRWSVPVKRLTARRFHPLQSPSVNERGKSWRRRAPMMMFVFAVQIVGAVIGIFWATVAVAARQSPPEQVAMEGTKPESDWPITPAHLRMW
jgi:hypothetical protein